MLFSVEQAFVGRDEKRVPIKTPAWEATRVPDEVAYGIYEWFSSLYSTSLRRVQITPEKSTDITRYLYFRRPPGLTGFLQRSHEAENSSFPEIVRLNKTVF